MSKYYSILFGLTADPIHKGHEQAIINGIEFCRDNGIEIEQFLLMPVYQPNLLADKNPPVASFDQRFSMCEMVADRLSKQLGCDIKVSPFEKELAENTGEKNYSFKTIRELNIDKQLFMVSADHFSGRWPKFRKWYKWRELLLFSGLLVNQRPGCLINVEFIKELKSMNQDVYIVGNSNTVNSSSSEIRANFLNTQQYLADDVFAYVQQNKIYTYS